MSKLTRKELNKIESQMVSNKRGDTWVGIRPAEMDSDKDNKKVRRRKSKELCKNYDEYEGI